MKKILLLLCSMTISAAAWAEDYTDSQGVAYTLTQDGENYYATVSSYTDELSETIEIPASITQGEITYSVTSIGNNAFAYSDLSSITIPSSVVSIGAKAFASCTSLGTMVVASDNQNYTSTVNGNEYNAILSKDGKTLIFGCKNSEIPNSVENIADNAFYDINGLESISIPESVVSIGAQAFYAIDYLKGITIPASVTSIGDYAFYSCGQLNSFTINRSGTEALQIGEGVWAGCTLSSITLKYTGTLTDDCTFGWSITGEGYSITNATSTETAMNPGTASATLSFCITVPLYDETHTNATYAQRYAAYSGKMMNYTLSGRTLYAGEWNTLCLPFSLTSLTGTVLEGAQVKTLSSSTFSSETLNLTFSDDQSSITAGVPCLVKPSADIVNPTFSNVILSAETPGTTETDYINFVGNFEPMTLTTNVSQLYLGPGNTLYYPNGNVAVNAFRGYFVLQKGLTAGSTAGQIRAINLDFSEETESTSITTINADAPAASGWFTLDGRRLLDEPEQPGMYIRNGQKVMIK